MKIVGYQIFFTDYQFRHLGNPSGLPGILLKIDPCILYETFCKLCDVFQAFYIT